MRECDASAPALACVPSSFGDQESCAETYQTPIQFDVGPSDPASVFAAMALPAALSEG